ncbi:MAG: S8 family serine peptidase [Gammaproteobacteria bacterium]|nr:S8 family serine peptidase [Gammaproteobacteria bacterium]
MPKSRLSVLQHAILSSLFCLPIAVANAAPPDAGRYIVHFKTDFASGKALLKSQGLKTERELPRHNAVALHLSPGQLKNLSGHAKVAGVEPDAIRVPLTHTPPPPEVLPYGIAAVQADLVSDAGSANRMVCVIDTGYDLGHEDLPGLDKVSGSDDIGGAGPWAHDGYGHGTHVAGTIAALGGNGKGVIGVLPGNQLRLHIVRVFGDNGDWAYSSTLVAALERCQDAGAHVVNMSLGGDRPTALENEAFRKAEKAGIVSVAAAGNDGDGGWDRMLYPASYESVISVGAVDENLQVAAFSQENTQVDLAAPGVRVLSTVPTGSGLEGYAQSASTTYDGIPMAGSPQATVNANLEFCGLGREADACAPAGKHCLIQRGEITFAEKVQRCEARGGVGAIIYNHSPGALSGTLGGAVTHIPSLGVTMADGEALKLEAGPVTLSVGLSGYDYAYFNGTSMATPHVAGVAALVWSHYPQCSNSQIRDALFASAKDLGKPGPDHTYGMGLVQAKAAVDWLSTHPCQ